MQGGQRPRKECDEFSRGSSVGRAARGQEMSLMDAIAVARCGGVHTQVGSVGHKNICAARSLGAVRFLGVRFGSFRFGFFDIG